MNKTCPQCNHIVENESKFCSNCGYKFTSEPNKYNISCPKCKNIISIGDNFCEVCGYKLSEIDRTNNDANWIPPNNVFMRNSNNNQTQFNKSTNNRKELSKLGIIALIFAFLGCLSPIGLVISIIDIARNRKIKNVVLSIIALVISIIMLLFALLLSTPDSDTSTNKETTKSESEMQPSQDDKIEDESPLNNAVSAIGMDPNNIKNINDLDDWSNGKRYSFIYDGFEYIVYELDNGEISSINNESLTVKIYEKGYEPLNYKDFEPDKEILSSLQEKALTEVSKYINNETSIKTVSGSVIYSRIYDYYMITGEVKAKNNVDKENYSFSVDFIVDEDNATCKYVAVNGVNMYGNKDEVPIINKIELSSNDEGTSGSSSTFIISDGREGDYGKYDDFDGEKYLRYYIPEGKYSVKCITSGGFYIETIELHKEDGYDMATTISQYDMKSDDVIDITINSGECISLMTKTELEFIKE